MFAVDQNGIVTRSDPAPGSHAANVLALVSPPSDFDSLSQEARISSFLMPDLLTNAVAPSTAKSYENQWRKFGKWCQSNSRTLLPSSAESVQLYLANVALRSLTLPPVLAARAAIGFYNRLAHPDIINPTETQAVRNVVQGIKRKFARVICKKKPLTPDMVRGILEHLTRNSLNRMNLFELRSAAFFCVLYFAAARFEEASELLTENIMVSVGGNLELLFIKSKTNQFRNAISAFLTPHEGAGSLDPAKLVLFYRNELVHAGGSKFFFPSLTGARVPVKDSKISYNNARNLFLRWLREGLGMTDQEAKEFGLHSCRIGSATNAAYGCTELEVQHHGRWKSREQAASYAQRCEAEFAKVPSILLEQVLTM